MQKIRYKKLLKERKVASILLILWDFISIHIAYFLALWGRFDFAFSQIPDAYSGFFKVIITPCAFISILIFLLFRMYVSIWRFAGYVELTRTITGSFLSSVLHVVFSLAFVGRMPISYYLFGAIIQVAALLVPRFGVRFALLWRSNHDKDLNGDRIMIIGAGSAGQLLLKDIETAKEIQGRVLCFIDDNRNKWGMQIAGVPIVGGREDILPSVDKYRINKIYFAIPSASFAEKREILGICNETQCELKQIPGFYQFVNDEVSVKTMKDVSIEDLLGREPISVNLKEVYDFINNKVVLVTGGGGSIGSELCRQIAAHSPKLLIIFDIYENNAYEIQLELRKNHPDVKVETLIGSVRDSRRVFEIFERFRPQIVYHAAAHKHVPLMEDSPNEAIKNNALGTYKTAYAAMVHGCERFVLISTDKAVNPTNIMGASKRLCEMIIQSFDAKIKAGKANEIPQLFTHEGIENADKDHSGVVFKDIKTEFVAVRFGNVLGSNGSVIPLFRKQIEEGGPVTVTHPDIIRYFMTIPEAVSLVLLAGTYARGGEIFVLDMGSPVKIVSLARNLIKLSGFTPDVDIKIEYTGLRPGEKLYEEKLMAEEGLEKTDNDLIHIGHPVAFDVNHFLEEMKDLMAYAYRNKDDVKNKVAQIVTTYHEAE